MTFIIFISRLTATKLIFHLISSNSEATSYIFPILEIRATFLSLSFYKVVADKVKHKTNVENKNFILKCKKKNCHFSSKNETYTFILKSLCRGILEDYMVTLEKDYDYRDEHFDFIQQWVRRFCLQYGAALFYTSVKEDKNCDLLYKYLMHRIYGFPFRTPALVVEKDAVLIPAGWDNMKKISILYENMQSMRPDDYYTDVIAKPVVRKSSGNLCEGKPVARETEIQADEEQAFLNRQLQLLNQGGGGTGAIGVGNVGVGGAVGSAGGSLLKADVGGVAGGPGGQLRSPAGVQKTGDRRVAGGSPGVQSQLGSPKKIDGTKVGVPGSGEGVLANFFNSLLSKKTGSPIPKSADLQAGSGVGLSGGSSSLHHHHLLSTSSSPLSVPDKASAMAMRSDAAAELDRLTRAAKKTSSPTSSPLMSLNQNSNASGETHGNSSEC
ncbi:hypothetical protein J437_LFUL001537 [Ladona fulva]|uniref:Dynein light intermediate chain n=1 Tax=Ladona fulva TaxID=123851 RepID=A0A8K0JWQ9_LADFU|nr:hypothetical protein J437_LFUL001537 [Ladona fulva]